MGMRRYYTGKPCCRGHVAWRHLSGACETCDAIKTKAVGARRRQALRAARLANPQPAQRATAKPAALSPVAFSRSRLDDLAYKRELQRLERQAPDSL
jgi:hypothetical protein